MPLKFQRIDAMGPGQPLDDIAHAGNGHETAMQHDHRIALSRDLVINLHAVDRGPHPLGRGLGHGRTGPKRGGRQRHP